MPRFTTDTASSPRASSSTSKERAARDPYVSPLVSIFSQRNAKLITTYSSYFSFRSGALRYNHTISKTSRSLKLLWMSYFSFQPFHYPQRDHFPGRTHNETLVACFSTGTFRTCRERSSDSLGACTRGGLNDRKWGYSELGCIKP